MCHAGFVGIDPGREPGPDETTRASHLDLMRLNRVMEDGTSACAPLHTSDRLTPDL